MPCKTTGRRAFHTGTLTTALIAPVCALAVAPASAADLPVKAKAVEYVKVCSLYGAGFFYIPGTDTCIKIGGFVRTEWNHNAGGSFAPTVNEAPGYYTRATDTLVNRTRGLVSFDVRSQTEYGTLRSYIRAAWQWTSNTDTIGGSSTAVYLDRAFIQFAGFTFGKTQSFFDVPDIADMTYQTEYSRNNTGGSGTPVFAYTAMLGNGVTATLSIEDYTERRANIVPIARFRRHKLHSRPRQHRLQPRQRDAGHRRQPARRPGLGFGPGLRRAASQPGDLLPLPTGWHRHRSSG